MSGTCHQAAYWHCIILYVLELCGPLGTCGNLPVFPGGVVTVARVVAVPLPPTGVN